MPSSFFPLFPLFLLFLSPSLCFSSSSADEQPIVTTEYGQIRGQLLRVVDPVDGQSVPIFAFLGVPFARPPLGELRFEKPLKATKWDGILNATAMAPACWPIARAEIWAESDQLSEDCLYLNIFGSAKSSPDANLLPVLVHIHGGGFQAGTIRQFKPEAVAKFVRRGLLFVTIQYRLAVLGFASTGAASFAGNYGLWDQAMALQFLGANLRRFGGDPSLVTLWGFSAGATSVGHLAASPHANGHFKYAIEQSGNTLAKWAANGRRVLGETRRLAEAVGCGEEETGKSAEALKNCLRQKTPDELMDGIDKIGRGGKELNFLQFFPRIDADFFPAPSDILIKNAPPKRTIMGVTSHEALSFTLLTQDPSLMSTQIPRAQWPNFGRAEFEKFLAEKVAPKKFFGDTAKMAQQRILEFYVDQNGEVEKNEFWLGKYTELITDTMFLVPMLWEAEKKSAAGWPIYLYYIGHINSGYPPDIPVKGSFHGVELGPLFDIYFPYKIENATEEDKQFRLELIDTITSFTKTGVPSTVTLPNWLSTDHRHAPFQYALFSSGGTQMEKALAPEKLKFWSQLSREFPFDIIRGIQSETEQTKDEF